MRSTLTKHPSVILIGILLAIAAISGAMLMQEEPVIARISEQQPNLPAMSYVGRRTCVDCHAEQDRLWQGSHHDLAMQEANEETVLGDFDNGELTVHGITTRFFRRNERHFVNTDGPDGQLADFEIKYTFGVTPLQQYLIEFPDGRLQAFGIAWDSRAKDQGGQRWFHLYPDEPMNAQHELHWTQRLQNWNFMCAECHSTHVQKNYNPLDRTYDTRWAEIDVSCEACHGPASHHLIWARRIVGHEQIDGVTKGLTLQLDERSNVNRDVNPLSGNTRRDLAGQSGKEIQTCGQCHSRRTPLFDDPKPGQLLDSHVLSLLQASLYHADGQIKDEVYEYGSFAQSKMYQAGVTCSDCHEPHSLKLRVDGNGVCLQCHAGDKYETETHHFHPKSAGSGCVDCHMPIRTYMIVDTRRDHQFSIPRPHLAAQIGAPNACTACHADQTPQWAADNLRKWYGHDPGGYQNYAEALHAVRSGTENAYDRLMALLEDRNQPVIARATAIEELDLRLNPRLLNALVDALHDDDPLLRSAGLTALGQLPPTQRWLLASERLQDPVRSVRVLAAAMLKEVSSDEMSPSQQISFHESREEYLHSLRFNADDPAAQVSLGDFHTARVEYAEAEQAYREALFLDKNWIPAYINYADLLRRTNRDGEGETVLREGLIHRPEAGALQHGLGLLLVRKKDLSRALVFLKRAVELEPEIIRYSYIYAVALHSAGQSDLAQVIISSALSKAPNDLSLKALKTQLTGK